MWVDSICLDQCNAESMAFEIGRMYAYCKNSYCSIVNLNGSGEQKPSLESGRRLWRDGSVACGLSKRDSLAVRFTSYRPLLLAFSQG